MIPILSKVLSAELGQHLVIAKRHGEDKDVPQRRLCGIFEIDFRIEPV